MAPSKKRQRIAAKKRELAESVLKAGGTQADAARTVKRKFGSGIATRDLAQVKETMHSRPAAEDVDQLDKATRKAKRKYVRKSKEIVQFPPGLPLSENPQSLLRRNVPPPPLAGSTIRRFTVRDDVGAVLANGVVFSNGKIVLASGTFEWLDP